MHFNYHVFIAFFNESLCGSLKGDAVSKALLFDFINDPQEPQRVAISMYSFIKVSDKPQQPDMDKTEK